MDFFVNILNLSLVSSYVIVFVLIARLLLKKAPKIYSYMLWIIVFVRLTCSFTFELPVGLIPESQPVTEIIYQQPQTFTIQVNEVSHLNYELPTITESVQEPTPVTFMEIALYIWVIGVLLMLSYNLFSYVKLKRNLAGMLFKDNIYFSDYITSPFVIDVIKPKIYLPSDIKASEIDFIITHEKTHIKRFDHVTRIVAFFVLSLHWFNPLVWCAYFLSGRDMELSCDEEVIKQTSSDIRKEYSQSLLNFAAGRVITTPAFGVNITIDTKERIQNIMKFKKPVAWVTALAITSVTVLSIGCMATTSADEFTSINQVSQDEIYKLTIQKNDITFSGLITSQFFSGSEIEDIKYNHYDFVLENIEFFIAGNEVDLGEQHIANIIIDEEDNNLLVTFDIETDTKSKISYEFYIDKTDNSIDLIKNNTSSDFADIITTDVITMLALEIYDYAITKDDINFIGVGEVGNNDISAILQPFSTSTSTSSSNSTNLINDTSQNKLFADYYGEVDLTQDGSNFYFPDIYISPNNMAIFTLKSNGLPLLDQTDIEISYNLGNGEALTLETGIIFDSDYIQINKVQGSSFLESYTTNSSGEHYLCITNYTSENAIIQNGIIQVNGELINQDNSRFNYEKDGIILSIANTSDLFNVSGESTMIISYDTKLSIDGKDIQLDESNSTLIACHENEAEQSFSFILNPDIIGEHITHNFSIDNDGNITRGTSELTEHFEELITFEDIENICIYFYEIAKTQTHNTIFVESSYGGEVSISEYEPVIFNMSESSVSISFDDIEFSMSNNDNFLSKTNNSHTIELNDLRLFIAGEEINLGEQSYGHVYAIDNDDNYDVTIKLLTDINIPDDYYPLSGELFGESLLYNFAFDKKDGTIVTQTSEIDSYFDDIITTDEIAKLAMEIYNYAKAKDAGLLELPEKPTIDENNPIFTFQKDNIIVSAQNSSSLFQQHDNILNINLADVQLSIDGKDIYLSDEKNASVSCHENEDSKDYFFKLSTHINRTENYYPAEGNFAGEYIVYNFSVDDNGDITVNQSLISDYFIDIITTDDIEKICLNLSDYATQIN